MTREKVLWKIARAKDEGWKSLALSNQKLTVLPDAIGELTALESLDLSGNELRELPASIGGLTGLRSLVLGRWDEVKGGWIGNKLSQLLSEIGQLSNLSQLYLSANQLSQLPPEIGQLSNLTELDLYANQLSQLPPEIGHLNNLTWLYLSANQLSQLPPEIGALSNLTKLYLDANQLIRLPPEIGALSNLTELYLDANQLSRLPPEIGALSNLKELDLRDNQLPIPPEILGTSPDILGKPVDILNYYFQLQSEPTQPLNEAKLLLVGQGSVGKTSLVNRLLHNHFDTHEDKTKGIQIQPWQVDDIQLNVWDFGGQEIMHATHQFFLTKRSLYLLVVDNRLGEEENRLNYWLKIIQSFGSDSPVIVVGNKIDQGPLDLDRRGLQSKYPSIQKFVETSCQTGKGIDDLKVAITEQIGKLEHVKDKLPLSWFELKQQLEAMDKDYMPYREYVKLCQDKEIEKEQSQQTLIGFLHDLGVVLNFREDPRLEDTNILNPVWVTNGVYQILNDNALMTEHKGILKRTMLDRILDAERYPKNKQLFIIDMMRKFELCFDLVPDKQFLIPDLLSKEEPYTGKWSDVLAFQYHYNVLPRSIISRFIVRASAMLHQKTYWRSGAVLTHEGNKAVVKADKEDKKIFIWVSGSEGTRRNLLTAIRTQFDAIHQTITGIEAIEKVPLPDRPDITVSYEHLLTLERKNVPTFIPDGLEEPVNVKQLLDGVAPVRSRSKQAQDFYDEDRTPKAPQNQYNFYAPVGSAGNQGTQQNTAGTVEGDQIGTQHNTAADLAAAAKEIQQLLEQLSQTYPTTTLPEQMTVAAKVVEEIESKPQLKTRIIGALKAAGGEAFKEAIDHPAVNVLFAAIAGWKDARE